MREWVDVRGLLPLGSNHPLPAGHQCNSGVHLKPAAWHDSEVLEAYARCPLAASDYQGEAAQAKAFKRRESKPGFTKYDEE